MSFALCAETIGIFNAAMKADHIAAAINVHKSSIARLIKQYQKTGSYQNLSHSGRSHKISTRKIHVLKNYVDKCPRTHLAHLHHFVSKTTIRRTLRRIHYYSTIAARKRWLNKKHQK